MRKCRRGIRLGAKYLATPLRGRARDKQNLKALDSYVFRPRLTSSLIDDRGGRAEAARRRLRVTGTLGVLADAHLDGIVDFDKAITRLHSTNFRLDPDLERIVRRRISTGRKEP
jgi:hypothetical protein